MTLMDGFMNNRGSVVAFPLNHCLLSKQSLSVCRKDVQWMFFLLSYSPCFYSSLYIPLSDIQFDFL
jgi:hypothetical protein